MLFRSRERLAIAPLIGIIVFMGVYPKPFLDRIDPSVKALITHVEEHSNAKEPAAANAVASATEASK